MTFLDNPLAEAILIELRRIAAAGERMATAYEKVAKFAESKGSSAPAKSEGGSEPKKERKKADPKDILSVTGYVLHFGEVVNAANGEPKLTKGGRPYWSLKLTNGFEAKVFSTTQATICSRAYDEQKPIIVDYVKEGQYNNIESVKLGVATVQPAGREPGEDEDEPF
jgi:hypothetical protein